MSGEQEDLQRNRDDTLLEVHRRIMATFMEIRERHIRLLYYWDRQRRMAAIQLVCYIAQALHAMQACAMLMCKSSVPMNLHRDLKRQKLMAPENSFNSVPSLSSDSQSEDSSKGSAPYASSKGSAPSPSSGSRGENSSQGTEHEVQIIEALENQFEMVIVGMKEVTDVMRDGNNIMERSIAMLENGNWIVERSLEILERSRRRYYHEDETFNALREIGVPRKFIFKALSFLMKNECERRMFFGLPVEMRAEFLLSEMDMHP